MCRVADQHVWSSQPSGDRNGNARGTEMYAIGTDCHSNVNSIIDKEKCAELCGKFPQLGGEHIQFPATKILLPELNCPGTADQRLTEHAA